MAADGNRCGAGAGSEPMPGLAPAPTLNSTPTSTSTLTPTPWQPATVERVVDAAARAKTFTLRLARPIAFRAGQHCDVRLTAPDGYQAQRSYSIASPPPANPAAAAAAIDLTVELIPDGEVSPYFHGVAQPGDALELRGPIGGPFTWIPEMGGPLLLLAGGSGIVPLRSILGHREEVAPDLPALLLYSARAPQDIIYRDWLDHRCGAVVRYALTRRQPAGWAGYARRLDQGMLRDCLNELAALNLRPAVPLCYACGPAGFVETAADALLAAGIPEAAIRTERFGPTA